ncbi:rhamnulose-1-phosphate aldolase [Enterococcus sp. BWB1-3]|uniref:rhamnulose-1-phosphate aldolase n=1 Tax=Enterococcus sp. BWB1-3 TaxID=2787713 RepID=UPI001922AA17|nr:rhamnulose-1-phosphate aldolase [Enterococcus sp. BWB1-3]MBL1229097.1 rhamnulose-1-phosphate aldolase [Enterococcus sp. BWB1-3]
MKDVLNYQAVKEMIDITSNLYRLGWDERNGGNISYLLEENEVLQYVDAAKVLRNIPMIFNGEELIGKYFLVTGSGKFFKNVAADPETNLGIIRVAGDGESVDLLWGYKGGGVPTSELPAHFMSHIARLEVDSENRVVMHCHATHLLAMSFTHDLTPKVFTRTLWEMCTECLVVFPEGVGILPWLTPGTNEIGEATAEMMKVFRIVLWPFHGIYGAGKTMDETFGLIETAEKAAEVYTYVCAQGGVKQRITDENFRALAKQFGVVPNKDFF